MSDTLVAIMFVLGIWGAAAFLWWDLRWRKKKPKPIKYVTENCIFKDCKVVAEEPEGEK